MEIIKPYFIAICWLLIAVLDTISLVMQIKKAKREQKYSKFQIVALTITVVLAIILTVVYFINPNKQ